MLGLADKKHEATLARIQDHIDGKAPSAAREPVTLDRFSEPQRE